LQNFIVNKEQLTVARGVRNKPGRSKSAHKVSSGVIRGENYESGIILPSCNNIERHELPIEREVKKLKR
jgi:hypothetical protein